VFEAQFLQVTLKPSSFLLVSVENPCDQLKLVAKSSGGNLSPLQERKNSNKEIAKSGKLLFIYLFIYF